MDSALADFLSPLRPAAFETVTWWGTTTFTVACYLQDALPPKDFISSARAVVVTDDGVAVCTNPDGRHVLPGGRLEASESLEQALHREVLEETGCELAAPALLGFAHFHHETPRPERWRGPYPDFGHAIFAARVTRVIPENVDPDGWEQSVDFVPAAQIRNDVGPGERLFLDAALARLRVNPEAAARSSRDPDRGGRRA